MRSLFAFLALLALPLSAQVLSTIEFDPPAPDSSMPVQVHLAGLNGDACVPSNPVARVNGSSITIHVDTPHVPCIQIVTPWGERADIGRLAPGEYDVRMTTGNDVVLGATHLSVSDANQPFIVLPSVAEAGGGRQLQLTVNIGEPLCAPSAVACAEVESVTIGGKAAQFSVVDGTTITATAPPNPPGPAVIAVKLQGLAAMNFTAFRYFDGNAAPDPAAFDRVLFPVFFSGPGAFDSFWTTSAAIANRAIGFVGEWRTVTEDPSIPCASPLPCRGPVHPGAAAYVASVFSRPQGLLYFPERRYGGLLRYALHVRDTSRSSQDLGTQIPVVTPRQLTYDIWLLDIPTDARYRRTLRIFDVDSVERTVSVLVLPMGELTAAGETFTVPLSTGCTDALCDRPAFASVNLDPIVAKFPSAPAVRVRVSSPMHDARLFAVATVTNNDTQHVTAY